MHFRVRIINNGRNVSIPAVVFLKITIGVYSILLLRKRLIPSRRTTTHTAEPSTAFMITISHSRIPSNDTSIDSATVLFHFLN